MLIETPASSLRDFVPLFAACVFARRPALAAPTLQSSRSLHADLARSEISAETQRRLTMKTIFTLLTTTMLVAGATSAMAWDRQATDDAMNYEISQRAAQGFGGAFGSARVPGEIENSTVYVPRHRHFQR